MTRMRGRVGCCGSQRTCRRTTGLGQQIPLTFQTQTHDKPALDVIAPLQSDHCPVLCAISQHHYTHACATNDEGSSTTGAGSGSIGGTYKVFDGAGVDADLGNTVLRCQGVRGRVR